MRTLQRALGLVALLVLAGPLAASASVQGPYNEIYIVVKDLSTNKEIGTIRPGGTFTLPEGARVRLILTAVAPGRGRGPAYPETQFYENEPGRGWVRMTRTNVENANATLEIVRPENRNRSRTETLTYKILEDIGVPAGLRQGFVNIRVEPSREAEVPPSAPVSSYPRARELTNTLYQAILQRDLDENGALGYIDRIRRGGYPELVRVAEDIAQSEESRVRIYEKEGVTNQQRLAVLYRDLLGLGRDEVAGDQWFNDIRRLNNGQIGEVVADMVRSERFREVHDVDYRTAVR